MESESEKKEFHFPGVSWLKARLSRKMLFITAVFIIVCLLLTSLLFLRYLRSFVSNQYNQAIDETNRLADEVCSFLIGSDGETAALADFLAARQLLCTIHDADGRLLFDSRRDAPDSVYSTVCAENTISLSAGRTLYVEVQSASWSRDALTGVINGRIRIALTVYAGVMSLFAVLLIYFVMIVPVSQLRETMRKYYESGTLPARSERKDEIGRLQNTFAELTGVLDAKEKTERRMIASISHDIKTPLTSIINYIDLLKRENPEDPKIRGYLEVLENKAQRLKVLTEDVVEASKASTGNITLEMTELNFVELINQVIGEFEEKFEERNLQMVVHFDEEEAIICADGRRLWRVLENVFGNVSKYAMENTRVYVDVNMNRPNVQLALKNISAQPLNITADELTERFIRGDVSRNTEGSGLGLSIAKDLVQLQGGTFNLYLDGDLFKVTIEFKMK